MAEDYYKVLGVGREATDDLLDFGEGDPVTIENVDAVKHQLVVVRLVTRGATQFGDAGALGDGDPDFRRQYALHVQSNN